MGQHNRGASQLHLDRATVEHVSAQIRRSAARLASRPLDDIAHAQMFQALGSADEAREAAARIAAQLQTSSGVDSGESAQLVLDPHRANSAAAGGAQ